MRIKRRFASPGLSLWKAYRPIVCWAVDENDELIDPNTAGIADGSEGYGEERDFAQMILENLKTAGVQQAHKEDKINFTALIPWPGDLICAEGRFSSDQWPVISEQKQTTGH